MNRPKQNRAMIEIKPIGQVPARTGPNHHKQFRQPKGYYSQVRDLAHFHPRSEALAFAA